MSYKKTTVLFAVLGLLSATFAVCAFTHAITIASVISAQATYTITATDGANGSISPSGAVPVDEGSSKTFTISPDASYHIADVLVDDASVGAVSSYTFENVTADHTIHATFAINTHTITATAGANGSISPSGEVSVNEGSSKTFTISPDDKYHILDVEVDGASVGKVSSHTFVNVTKAHTIHATFAINTHTITASDGANGSISPEGSVVVNEGSSKTFTITPDEHYHIADVLVNGNSVGAPSSYTFADVAADHTIHATFAINTHTITATAGDYGVISPEGSVVVNEGSSETFTIIPEEGCYIADVFVDDVSVGAVDSYTFENVAADHTIHAEFDAPMTPVELRAFPRDGGVLLMWTDSTREGVVERYNVYSRTDVDSPYEHIGSVDKPETSYVHDGLTNDVTYYYMVVSIDTDGNESSHSNQVGTTPKEGAGDPWDPVLPDSGDGCFIATVAYGSGLAREVKVLAKFRDNYLLASVPGRAFVSCYYLLGPPTTKVVSRSRALRAILRIHLAPIVRIAGWLPD